MAAREEGPEQLRLPYELVAPPVRIVRGLPALPRAVVEVPAADVVVALGGQTWRPALHDDHGRAAEPASGASTVLRAAGGGRVMVEAAARAARSGLPWVAVPTTYAPAALVVRPQPALVLADPALPWGLPAAQHRTSLLAARAVAVEALWAPDGTPSVRFVALSALRTLTRLLALDRPAVAADVPAEAALRAALTAAAGSGNCAPGLLTALSRSLDARRVLPYATAMAALLPRVLHWQGVAARDAVETVTEVAPELVAASAGTGSAGGPALPVLPAAEVDAVATELTAREATYLSPRTPTATDVRRLLVP